MDVVKRRWQFLSGSWLKLIAMTAMLIDHVTIFVLAPHTDIFVPLFTVGDKAITVYYILRTVGRLAFPLYCFLLTEGFVHTKSRKRYGINLLLFALIAELPWNFVHTGMLLYEKQNVFFTLLFGYCALCMIEHLKARPVLQAVGIFGLFVFSYFFKADYGYMGMVAIIAMYMLRQIAVVRMVVCTCLFSAFWRAGLAFLPIGLYNGERGFIKGKIGKYICYAFYPVHLLVLAVIRLCL